MVEELFEEEAKKGEKTRKMLEKEKTIGEILKEEGIITEPPEQAEGKIRFEEEIDLKETVMKLEKLEAQVTALKEVKFHADERIKELAESVGEIRSLLFQRDAEIRENITKVEKLEERIGDIKPENIAKEMQKKEEEIEKSRAETEKLDIMAHDLLKRTQSMEKILDNIKSMENLIEMNKEMGEKIAKMEELNNDTKRYAGKIEKLYLDSERKNSQIAAHENKIKDLDNLTKELIKSDDNFSMQMKTLVTKEDMEKGLKNIVHVPKSDDVNELKIQKKEIESVIKNLKDQYKNGIITKESYDEVTSKNNKILEQMEEKIRDAGSGGKPKDLQSWLESIEGSINNIELKLGLSEEKMKRLEFALSKIRTEKTYNEPKIRSAPRITAKKDIIRTSYNELPEDLEIDEIRSLLASLEDEYRRGIISETTYQEVKERNLEKLKGMVEGTPGEIERIIRPVPIKRELAPLIADEITELKIRLRALKESNVDTSELESLVKQAENKITLGYVSIAKLYLEEVRKKMMMYE